MTEYDEHINRLTGRIHEVRLLRDAQRPDSAHHDRFQDEIYGLTSEMLEWRDAAPELERLDDEIRAAERQLNRADKASEDDVRLAGWAAKWFGVLGIICLLVSVTWMPSAWFPVLTFVFLALAVASIMLGTRGRQERSEAVNVAESELYSLRARRDHRVPDRAATRSAARSIPAVGRVLVEPEREDADVD